MLLSHILALYLIVGKVHSKPHSCLHTMVLYLTFLNLNSIEPLRQNLWNNYMEKWNRMKDGTTIKSKENDIFFYRRNVIKLN